MRFILFTSKWPSFTKDESVLLFRVIPDVSSSSVAERVKKGIEPFLRCAAVFFHCLTGVHPPEELFSAAG